MNKKVFYILLVILFWLVVPTNSLMAQTCIAVGQTSTEETCQKTVCCEGLVCKEITDWSNVSGDGGVIGSHQSGSSKPERYTKCLQPQPGEELEPGAATTEDSITFKPNITIPGSIKVGGKEFTIRSGEGFTITGDTIANYIKLFYQFFISMLAIIAVVMVIWGGFKRIMAAGNTEKITASNETIFGAIIGLVLALVSYSLLNLINPSLVSFKTLDITKVNKESMDWETEEQLTSQPIPNIISIVPDVGMHITMDANAVQIDSSIRDLVYSAAQALVPQSYGMKLTSSYRNPEQQTALIKANCPENAKASSQCRPDTCLMLNGPTSCPHTTGRAVDAWGTKDGKVCIQPPEGMKITGYCSGEGKEKCLQDPCQQALIQAMRAQGFCLLCKEPWHFEKPKMSACCN